MASDMERVIYRSMIKAEDLRQMVVSALEGCQSHAAGGSKVTLCTDTAPVHSTCIFVMSRKAQMTILHFLRESQLLAIFAF